MGALASSESGVGNLQLQTHPRVAASEPISKTRKRVDKTGLSPNPVEEKRGEMKGFGRDLLITQKPSFG